MHAMFLFFFVCRAQYYARLHRTSYCIFLCSLFDTIQRAILQGALLGRRWCAFCLDVVILVSMVQHFSQLVICFASAGHIGKVLSLMLHIACICIGIVDSLVLFMLIIISSQLFLVVSDESLSLWPVSCYGRLCYLLLCCILSLVVHSVCYMFSFSFIYIYICLIYIYIYSVFILVREQT
jgi:hypothetical protein